MHDDQRGQRKLGSSMAVVKDNFLYCLKGTDRCPVMCADRCQKNLPQCTTDRITWDAEAMERGHDWQYPTIVRRPAEDADPTQVPHDFTPLPRLVPQRFHNGRWEEMYPRDVVDPVPAFAAVPVSDTLTLSTLQRVRQAFTDTVVIPRLIPSPHAQRSERPPFIHLDGAPPAFAFYGYAPIAYVDGARPAVASPPQPVPPTTDDEPTPRNRHERRAAAAHLRRGR